MNLNQYNQVFEQYRMPVFNFCNKLIGQRQDAEDPTVLTFISLWKRLDTVPVEKVRAFLMITAKNKCKDAIKHNKLYKARSLEVPEDIEQEFEREQISAEVMRYIIGVVDSLPTREREVIKMKYLYEMRQNEIAAELGISIQTVANTISTGLKKIRTKVKSF